jgi:hypothetical protein
VLQQHVIRFRDELHQACTATHVWDNERTAIEITTHECRLVLWPHRSTHYFRAGDVLSGPGPSSCACSPHSSERRIASGTCLHKHCQFHRKSTSTSNLIADPAWASVALDFRLKAVEPTYSLARNHSTAMEARLASVAQRIRIRL